MSDLSLTFRRVISNKRSGLKSLYSEVSGVSERTNGLPVDASANDCHKILLDISRLRKKLESSIEVIKGNATKWQTAIEELEEEDDKLEEGKTLTDYFSDSSTENRSIAAIESDITEQIHALAAEEDSLTRMMNTAQSRSQGLRGVSAVPNSMENMNITHTETVSSTQIPLPQLPSLTLPKFNGKDNYRDYWTVFSDLIDKKDLGEATKLRYLESSLKGEALELLRHLKKRGLEYSAIVKQFEIEYGKSEYARDILLEQWSTLRPKSDSLEEQLKLITEFETAIDCNSFETATAAIEESNLVDARVV